MSRYIQTSLTTFQLDALIAALKEGQKVTLRIYDEDDQWKQTLNISLPDKTQITKDSKELETITPAQKNRIQRFLSMPEVKSDQKIFLRAYLCAGRLSKQGARRVIYATICQLREKGIHLNRPSVPDCSYLFSDEVVSGD